MGKNAIRLDLHEHIKMHPIVHVIHTTTCHEQLVDIALLLPRKSDPVPALEGEEDEVKAILHHRKRGKDISF